MITLRQLRYFEALARFKHFGKAADAVAVTQPALSMQIKELEENLGVMLLERSSKGLQLTSAGQEVLKRAKSILSSVRDLIDYTEHCKGELAGPLRLGVIPSIAPYLLPRALPLIQKRFPNLQLHLRETLTHILVEELHRGELDVLLLALPIEDRDVHTMPLFDDMFHLAVRTDAEVCKKSLDPETIIAGEKLLLLEEGHCLREQALNYCSIAAPDSLESFGATSLSTVMQLVANGFGVTLLPEMCSSLEVKDGRVKLIQFEDPQPYRSIGLAWRRSTPRDKEFEALGKVISEAAKIDNKTHSLVSEAPQISLD